jgi:hypothetical protein
MLNVIAPAKVFVTGVHFHPGLMFGGEYWSQPSELSPVIEISMADFFPATSMEFLTEVFW